MRQYLLLPVAALPLIAPHLASAAPAETPAQFCTGVTTDDTLRPVPESLVPAVNTVFGTRMPARMATDTTVFRCASGHVLVCTTGASLPCGPANANRTPDAGMQQWCRDHPAEAFIPAVATGHDTIFEWRCRDGTPQVVRQTQTVDPRGFISAYWQVLP
jgi:hypothetical protein